MIRSNRQRQRGRERESEECGERERETRRQTERIREMDPKRPFDLRYTNQVVPQRQRE
jgi:formylmethanofuran dehydrogenase subunit E